MRDKKSFDYIDTTPDVSLTYDRAGRRAGTSDSPGNHALTYDDAASGDRVSGWSVSDAGAWKPATTRLRYNQRTRKNHCNQCFENPLAHIMPGMNGIFLLSLLRNFQSLPSSCSCRRHPPFRHIPVHFPRLVVRPDPQHLLFQIACFMLDQVRSPPSLPR